MQTEACPHCGEEQRALKNHIRLTDGGGHGSYGSYPDKSAGTSSSGPQTTGSTAPSPEESDEWMHVEEVGEAMEEQYEMGYQEGKEDAGNESYEQGYEDGYKKAQEELQQGGSSGEWPKQLPCGHDSVDAEQLAETLLESRGPVNVTCDECRNRYSIS